MQEMMNLTRRTINSLLGRKANDAQMENVLRLFSRSHYGTELNRICMVSGCSSLREEDTERWLAIFGKRIEEIQAIYEREGWDLIVDAPFQRATWGLIKGRCKLYQKQGKLELALELLEEYALKEEEDPLPAWNYLHAELCLQTGRIEEAFKSMEKDFSVFRSQGNKTVVVGSFRYYLDLVPDESLSLFEELIPQYPHVLWAASSAGFVELSQEENKVLHKQLEAKKGLHCVNCSKEVTKIYRCSRCELAMYCGSACQKEAWKEHKKICKKRE
jgi:tetratricopeptide (TPR) repeat protein